MNKVEIETGTCFICKKYKRSLLATVGEHRYRVCIDYFEKEFLSHLVKEIRVENDHTICMTCNEKRESNEAPTVCAICNKRKSNNIEIEKGKRTDASSPIEGDGTYRICADCIDWKKLVAGFLYIRFDENQNPIISEFNEDKVRTLYPRFPDDTIYDTVYEQARDLSKRYLIDPNLSLNMIFQVLGYCIDEDYSKRKITFQHPDVEDATTAMLNQFNDGRLSPKFREKVLHRLQEYRKTKKDLWRAVIIQVHEIQTPPEMYKLDIKKILEKLRPGDWLNVNDPVAENTIWIIFNQFIENTIEGTPLLNVLKDRETITCHKGDIIDWIGKEHQYALKGVIYSVIISQ
jgi:hypothetical protein